VCVLLLLLLQTEEARAEAITLMGSVNNLSTPKNGEILIAATQVWGGGGGEGWAKGGGRGGGTIVRRGRHTLGPVVRVIEAAAGA
jgi:hypothetical protein